MIKPYINAGQCEGCGRYVHYTEVFRSEKGGLNDDSMCKTCVENGVKKQERYINVQADVSEGESLQDVGNGDQDGKYAPTFD